MKTCGFTIQAIGCLVFIGGLITGFTARQGGLTLIAGGVVAGILLLAIGTACYLLADIAADARRSAESLESIAAMQAAIAQRLTNKS